ncbi:Protein of unknown function [Brevinema andersonii]|uniref:Mu-like prophage protein gp36 n=1 Tax=Brevinema andersonii TaxID=34097 RepID=A0A1I1DKP2_BREAD|nr:DUF1320 domain-containing protein [Brevinema andersonii]SFB75404.1 Protein of unknown function [Brevinema andersonii]
MKKNSETRYCSIEDIFNACQGTAVLSWAKDDSRESNETALSRINLAINRAEEEINLYIGKVYMLPLKQIPSSLTDICVRLTLYSLLSRKGLTENSSDTTIKHNRDSALKSLEMIANGKLDLGIKMPKEEHQICYSFRRKKW